MKLILLGMLLFTGCAYHERVRDNYCELHQVVMVKAVVPVSYGLPFLNRKYHKAMRERFPHAEVLVHGGCMSLLYLRQTRIYHCPECIRERDEYLATHSRKE